MQDIPPTAKTYSQKYYASNKQQFKVYYETAKQKRKAIADGTYVENAKLSEFQKQMKRYKKQQAKIEMKQQQWREQNPELVHIQDMNIKAIQHSDCQSLPLLLRQYHETAQSVFEAEGLPLEKKASTHTHYS